MPEGPDEKKHMESAASINQIKADNAQISESYAAVGQVGNEEARSSAPLKIRFVYKAILFCFSTVTLSWFFEGLRQCKESASPQGLAFLIGGTVLTLLLVGLQGFFIYCEERSKGLRTRKIALFDKWYLHLVSKQKGDYTNRG